MLKKPKRRKRPLGIFIYCTEEEKKRIDRARHFAHRTLSGYILNATMHQVEEDEIEMMRKKRK